MPDLPSPFPHPHPSRLVAWAAVLLGVAMPLAQAADGYELYQPTIERYQVSHTAKQHHDATMVWFKDRWIAQYDDHVTPATERQVIHQRTSFDLKTWSEEIDVYCDERGSANPIAYRAQQWQPGFIKVGEELWSIWVETQTRNINFSRLAQPDGRWINRTLYGNSPGAERPALGYVFVGNGGLVLSNGRIAVPVTHEIDGKYHDRIFYSDDRGGTWQMGRGTTEAHRGQTWEATIWEPDPGDVWMIARNVKTVERKGSPMREALGYSRSADFGDTWSALRRILPMECANDRPHVVSHGRRNILAQHDFFTSRLYHGHQRFGLALLFNRGPGVDFVAGPTIEIGQSEYPQIDIADGHATVIYSFSPKPNANPRLIYAARMELPEPDKHYLFARSGRTRLEEVAIDSRRAVRFIDDFSSAGIDLDENDPRRDEVEVSFAFKIEEGAAQTLMTIGQPPVRVLADQGKVRLASAQAQVEIGEHGDWTRIDLISGPDAVRARIGSGAWSALPHRLGPDGRWMSIGQGYYQSVKSRKEARFLIDLDTMRTQVRPWAKP